MADKNQAPTGYTAIASDPFASQVARDHSHPYMQGGRTAEEALNLQLAEQEGPAQSGRVADAPANGKQETAAKS